MKNSSDYDIDVFDITDLRGDWVLKDSGWAIAKCADDCSGLNAWDWHHPNATGWAKMTLRVDREEPGLARLGDVDCVEQAIKKAGGPDTVCVRVS